MSIVKLILTPIVASLLASTPWLAAKATSTSTTTTSAAATQELPDGIIRNASNEVIKNITSIKENGKLTQTKIVNLVNTTIMPYMDFEGMTASAVGPAWREISSDQKKELIKEFKQLLLRTYSGALMRISDQKITVRSLDPKTLGDEVVVNSVVSSASDGSTPPINLKYRLSKNDQGVWKIVDFNVMDIWLMQTYRSQFKDIIASKGVTGLIEALTKLNKKA